MGDDNNIYSLSTSDGTMLSNHSADDYAGLTYDSKNKVFWAIDWDDNIIVQLDSTTFQPTGKNYTSPTSFGEYRIVFKGEHLVITSWDMDKIYKVIIDLPPLQGGIPGFSFAFLLLAILPLIGIEILRQKKSYPPI